MKTAVGIKSAKMQKTTRRTRIAKMAKNYEMSMASVSHLERPLKGS